jgi:hypothetical protein
MRRLLAATAMGAVGLTLGCTDVPRVTIFNNSAATVTVWRKPGIFWTRFAHLKPGARLTTPITEMLPPGLVISAGGCEYGYRLPEPGPSYFAASPRRGRSLKVQIQRDLALVLLPATSNGKAASASGPLVARPIFDTCA